MSLLYRNFFRLSLGTLFLLGFSLAPALVQASTSVSIQSLSGTNVSVGQSVSFSVDASGFNNPTYSLGDSFSGSSASGSNINSSGNFSWTPESQDVGTHTLTITVSDSSGDTATVQEQITVSTQASLSIESLSPSSSVSPGQTLSFSAAASGFSSPTFSVSDSFSGSSVSSGDINSSGYFSWTPQSQDIGTHTFTIYASDNSGHSANAQETITVSATANSEITGSGSGETSIQGLEPGNTVIVGQPLSFTVSAAGFTNPVFNLQDPFSGTTVVPSDINTAGYFTWTPTQSQVGTHALTIYVNDSSGHSADIPLSIVVEEPNLTVTSITPGTTVTPGNALTMTVAAAGFTDPSYTLSDSFSGSSITNGDINSSGDFSWTPATTQDGTHGITIYATDAEGHSANTQITVYVNSGVSVALTAPTPSSTVAPGTTVTFTTDTFGFTGPVYSLSDSFPGSSLVSGDINSSGDFSWTPTQSDIGTHTITVNATDIYSHAGASQTTIIVSGTPTTSTTPVTTTSTATASTEFTDYLSPGSTGAEVSALQDILHEEGYLSVPATGYYGSLTASAVEEFQAAHDIEQLGVVGPSTRAALNALVSGTSSTSSSSAGDGYVFNNFLGVGSTGTDVTELQKRLTALGIYSGPVTGYYGSLTEASVKEFQGDHGIEEVGYVGPSTRAALNTS